MTIARKAAADIVAYLGTLHPSNSDNVGYDNPDPGSLVDKITEIVSGSVGEGPYDLATASTLNQFHHSALSKETGYSIEYEHKSDKFHLRMLTVDDGGVHHIHTTRDRVLLEAATSVLGKLDDENPVEDINGEMVRDLWEGELTRDEQQALEAGVENGDTHTTQPTS